MKKEPNDSELATFYAGIRNGDNSEQICRMLSISKRQLKFWLDKAKKAKKKQQQGFELDSDEKTCLTLKRLVRAADRRKRGWNNGKSRG